MIDLVKLAEPMLLFGHNQAAEDPREGLSVFGPLDTGMPYGIRAGAIGTRKGLASFRRWVQRIQGPVSITQPRIARPPFPGFSTVFKTAWDSQPAIEVEIPDERLKKTLFLGDKYRRVYETVSIYAGGITKALREEEPEVDVWFVVVPDEVRTYCRPQSYVEPDLRIDVAEDISPRFAQTLRQQPSLYAEENVLARPYHYEVNFHNQLKARLMEHRIPTQIVRESTIAEDYAERGLVSCHRSLEPVGKR